MDHKKKETSINNDPPIELQVVDCPSLLPINPRKKKICDAYVDGELYPIYEYDLRDLTIIEQLSKLGSAESDITFTMLRLAIPSLSEDALLSFTQSQSLELLAQIQATSILGRLTNLSSTVH